MCILLVEDEWLTLAAAEAALSEAGHAVLTADHGQAAYNHIASHPGRFTCLVTDHFMPGAITGAHVIEYMRPLYRVIPMVMTTGTTFAIKEDWRRRHDVHVLPKPYKEQELVALVGQLLS